MTLTIDPALQQCVWNTLTSSSASPPGANKDGAIVVIQPSTGNILAMVSNPTFDPNALVNPSLQAEQEAYYSYIQRDREGFAPLRPMATRDTFPPGSTMKVVTSTAVYNLKPSLAGFDYPVQACQTFTDSNKPLCDLGGPCGGTMLNNMLPGSCDPGYAELGVQLGRTDLDQAGRAVRLQLGAGHRPARHGALGVPDPARQLAGLLGAERHRPVRRGHHRAPERHGGGGHRQQRRRS